MTKPTDFTADFNFLYEMGAMRYIARTWRRFHGIDFANLAEHHFRVFWIAMVIAQREGADISRVAKLAMVHDIAESRAGDVDYLSRQYVERNQELAIHDMLGGTSLEKEFLKLWQEYEERESLESKIVKDADNLDVDMELAERASLGADLRDKWSHRKFVGEQKLYTDTAKQMFKALPGIDPHGWHIQGRNRNTADWKPSA